MDPNALDVLEFPAIRERLAAATSTELGAELATLLEPSPDIEEVARRQALTSEALGLLDESLEPPLEGIRDVRDQAAHAAAPCRRSRSGMSPTPRRDRCGHVRRSTSRPRRSSARPPP